MCLPVTPFKIEREWIGLGDLKCAVVQNNEIGHRCGYVRVPPTHPLYGKDYDEVDIYAHGGLTFAGKENCVEDDGQGWWFGFDCAHYGDSMYDPSVPPKHNLPSFFTEGHYWTESEVAEEVTSLAEQLARLIAVSIPIPSTTRKIRKNAPLLI